MSGESVAVVAVGAGIGAVALMGAAAGASCAFVVGHSLEALGSHLERGQARREAAHAVIMEWQDVLRDVSLRNGRIRMLRALAGQPGADGLPAPLELGAQTITELRAWCAEADEVLREVEKKAAGQEAQAILRRVALLAGLPELRTGFDRPGEQPDVVSRPVAGEPGQQAGRAMAPEVKRIAGRVKAGVTGTAREAIARAAERVLRADTPIEARNRLGDLRVRVDEANEVAERRYAEAAEAARLLQPLLHAGDTAQSLRADLLEVAAGNASLTGALRELARQAAAEVQQAADQRYIRKCVTESLAELGYVTDEGFQTVVPRNGVLQVTRSEWTAHGVQMVFDSERNRLLTALVRTKAEDRWDSAALDTEREEAWCAAQEGLKELLAAKSITLEVRSLTPPGQRRVPLVQSGLAQSDTSAAPSAAPRTGRA
jgi:hypothetical protein